MTSAVRQLRTLIVDDHEDVVARCRARFDSSPDLALDSASSRDEAMEKMREHMYDIIVVDLQLDESRPEVFDGEDVLDYAARRQPLAALYAWTAYPGLDTTRTLIIDSLLNADDAIAGALRGLIDKTRSVPEERAFLIAEAESKRRLSNPVQLEVAKLGAVANRLTSGRSISGWSEPSEIAMSARLEELQYLVSRLFGQGTDAGRLSLVRDVEIAFFDDLGAQGDEAGTGNSGATVFLARVRSEVVPELVEVRWRSPA